MLLKSFLLLIFIFKMLIRVQCGSIPPLVYSGSQLIQTGSISLSSTDISAFSAAGSSSITRSQTITLPYAMASYNLVTGFKKMNWYYYQGLYQLMTLQLSNSGKESSNFIISIASSYGATVANIQMSYLAIDSSLTNYIFTFSSDSVISSPTDLGLGAVLSGVSYPSLVWSGYKSTTKAILYSTSYSINVRIQSGIPIQSSGAQLSVTSISTSSFIADISFPRRMDTVSQFTFNVVYFNTVQLYANIGIISDVAFLTTGDFSSSISMGNTSLYTYTYAPGNGCDMVNNNTFIGVQPYYAAYGQLTFQTAVSSNSVFVLAQNFFAYQFSVVNFCSIICSTTTNPFFYNVNFQCYDVCPNGYYGNILTRNCELCATNCLTCSIASTNCASCANGLFLYNNTCLILCPLTTYGNTSLNQCLNCTGDCLYCQGTSTSCIKCISPKFLLNFVCYYDCPNGYYGDTSTYNCELCSTNCQTCSLASTHCTSCVDGLFLYNNTCLTICPLTTYGNTSVNQCLNCTGDCLYCQVTSTNCTKCLPPKFLLHFECYLDCPAGYYGNTTTQNCETCFVNCSTCTAVNICTQCKSNHYLWPNFDKCQTDCPPNYFPNATTKQCQRIVIQGCQSALYYQNVSICLQCNLSLYFKYVPSNKSCVCIDGYKLINGVCEEYCGDGIVNNMPCDDGNFINGDGCSFKCTIQNNFNCITVPSGPRFTSQCCYSPDISIQILSETKVDGQNTFKLILNFDSVPIFLTSDVIKQFLNIKIANLTINISNMQINYNNEVAEIYIPYTSDIEGKEMDLWTNFDPTKFCCPNVYISSILKGDNVALLFLINFTLYKLVGIFNYSMAIFVCIFALISSYKHKMIGLELVMPFQMILYSQPFYDLKTAQATFYTSFKPVSFSIFSPKQIGSSNNAWYRIGMTGGFLQNYNFLGLIFLVTTILLIVSMFRLQHGQRNRFKHKKSLRDWLNFGQFKILIRKYQGVIWKPYFVSFCLSTIPLIFSVSAKAMTVSTGFYTQSLFDVINDKFNYLFYIFLMGGLFYTSIPRIFYNNKKNLLKRHIFKREGEKFMYDANYCVYFELHYLIIGLIYAYCPSTLPVFFIISVINGLFFLYLIFKRPYDSILDNIGALLSNLIVVYYLSVNLFTKISGSSQMVNFLSKISGFLITCLLFVQCIVAIVRLIIFWINDKEQNLKGLATDQIIDKFHYQKDKAFNKFIKNGAAESQEVEFNNLMNKIQGQMILNQPKTINEQLIPKLHKKNTNENKIKDFTDCIFDQTRQKPQKIQQQQKQKYSSLIRVKNNLKESLKNYKLHNNNQQRQRQIQRQRLTGTNNNNNQNVANNSRH